MNLTTAARVAIIAGVIGVAATTSACGSDKPGDTANPAASPSPTAAATATPAATDPAGSAPTGGARDPATTTWPGTLSYLTVKRGKPITLRHYTNGTLTKTTTFGIATPADESAYAASPDGRHVAVLDSRDQNFVEPGDLKIINTNGTRRTIARELRAAGGNWPVWTPDSTAVILGDHRYDATTGNILGDERNNYLVYSPAGTKRAYAGPDHTVIIANADGTRRTSVLLPECRQDPPCPTATQAVSDNGRYLALGIGNTDPSHVTTTATVLDTTTGDFINLPARPRHVWFTTTGALIATATNLITVNTNWKPTATHPLPRTEDPNTVITYHH